MLSITSFFSVFLAENKLFIWIEWLCLLNMYSIIESLFKRLYPPSVGLDENWQYGFLFNEEAKSRQVTKNVWTFNQSRLFSSFFFITNSTVISLNNVQRHTYSVFFCSEARDKKGRLKDCYFSVKMLLSVVFAHTCNLNAVDSSIMLNL